MKRHVRTRVPNYASYLDKAKLHSEPAPGGTGCWEWFGLTVSGVPRVSRHPDDESASGPVNLRVALLAEVAGRPDWAFNAKMDCGRTDCVNPDHMAWEDESAFRARVAATNRERKTRVTDDRYKAAVHWDGSAAEIADRLGVSRATLYSHWARLGLRRNARHVG